MDIVNRVSVVFIAVLGLFSRKEKSVDYIGESHRSTVSASFVVIVSRVYSRVLRLSVSSCSL